ncbi:MAG: hypothetical protein KGI97_01460 [Alphaproteobacteria bacterium]|nr:hypothetical protein [Alphaproteobacteria bacterium]
MSHEIFFVWLSVAASLIRYGTYGLSIYRGKTRPHAFSWFSWGLVVAIGAYAQFRLGGGPSVWGLALVVVCCFAFSVLALFVGEKDITRGDWVSLGGAMMTIVFWKLTNSPVAALALLIVFDIFSYWPTIRKSWRDPWGEPPHSYFWAGLRYFFLLFSVPHPTASTLLYPFWLMASDWTFATYIALRRKALAEKKQVASTI